MILSAGLSPAWQQVLLFDTFTPGEVNRAGEAYWCASGKVLNTARALHQLGGPCRALTVVGGAPGEEMRADCRRLGVAAQWIDTAAPTRVCTTILDAARHRATELVPNAPELSAAEIDAFRAAYAEEAAAATVVVLIGSLPPGTPTGFYHELLTRTPGKAVLDARGPELLTALAARPFLIKPNREELQKTLGRDLPGDAELFEGMKELNARGAEWVLITDGPRPVHASSGGHIFRLQPPPAAVVNPIGCGDCMAAGVAWALFHGREPLEAIRYGLATAAAKLGQLLPGAVDREQVQTLVRAVDLVRL